MRILKGDTVIVLTGKDKGKTGKVVKAMPKTNKVLVEGVNVSKKHAKPTQGNPDGGIFEMEVALDVSNVAYYDEKSKSATKIGYKDENGKKVRFAKKSGQIIK